MGMFPKCNFERSEKIVLEPGPRILPTYTDDDDDDDNDGDDDDDDGNHEDEDDDDASSFQRPLEPLSA